MMPEDDRHATRRRQWYMARQYFAYDGDYGRDTDGGKVYE